MMAIRGTLVLIVAFLLVAGLSACKTTGPNGGGGGKSGGTSREKDAVHVGKQYVSKKVVVAAVDRSRLATGEVAVTLKNVTDDYLPDLAYELTLIYRNPDPKQRDSMPVVPETAPRGRLDLDAGESATVQVKRGVLSEGAIDVMLRVRAEKPRATEVGATFLSDRVRVLATKRDWTASPPRASFTVQNDWDSPLRLMFKVFLVKDGRIIGETAWKRASGTLAPKGQMKLEADLTRQQVGAGAGVYPALKIKRPNL